MDVERFSKRMYPTYIKYECLPSTSHAIIKSLETWVPAGTAIPTKYIYIEYHSVCPLVGIVILPTPSLARECAPLPPEPKGEGALACD
jgi:hypothetical protein